MNNMALIGIDLGKHTFHIPCSMSEAGDDIRYFINKIVHSDLRDTRIVGNF